MKPASLAAALLAGALAVACGGEGGGERVCASDGGTTACLVDGSGRTVKLEAEGFQPGSEVGIAGLNPGGDDQVGRVGRIGDNGKLEDDVAYEGSGGQIPEMVVTVQGTSRSGTPVILTVRRPAS